jgi:small subunit ribosomal protein S20
LTLPCPEGIRNPSAARNAVPGGKRHLAHPPLGPPWTGFGCIINNLKDENPMANTSSAKKAARKMIRRNEINTARKSRMKSDVRAVEEAIASGDKTKAEAALKAAQPVLMRTAQKGVIHKKTASRKVSRLASRVKALAG